jgi:S-formylglutathione hydrolase FrmB
VGRGRCPRRVGDAGREVFGDLCLAAGPAPVEHETSRREVRAARSAPDLHDDVAGRGGARRYPVLYLLYGASGSYADWAGTATALGQPQGGEVVSLVGTLPIIVVMPDDTGYGSYTDWYGISAKDAATRPVPRAPAWETYHISELIPWVDSTFATEASATGRVIAGLSSGGAGAAKYATAHPGLFGYVGTFSGALDNDLVDSSINWYNVSNARDASTVPDDRCTFGDPFTADAENSAYSWYDNDPTYEAGNLAGVKLFVASGDGTPTKADAQANPGVVGVEGGIERVVDDMSHHFVAAVRQAGLGATLTTDFYGPGVHGWYYWRRDLTAFLRWLRPQLGHAVSSPPAFSYRTARATSQAWGWTFRHDSGLAVPNVNSAEEFVYLTHVSTRGLTAAGDGVLHVTTPARAYPPRASFDVVTRGVARTVEADGAGRLIFDVVIGAPATHSQVTFPASGPPPGMARVDVSISAVPAPAHKASRVWIVALVAAAGAAALSLVAIKGTRRRARPRP